MEVQDLTDELAKKYAHEGEKGVVIVNIQRGSQAARVRQIRVGCLIQEIDFNVIRNVKDYTEYVQSIEAGAKVTLYVRYPDGGGSFVTLQNGNAPKDK